MAVTVDPPLRTYERERYCNGLLSFNDSQDPGALRLRNWRLARTWPAVYRGSETIDEPQVAGDNTAGRQDDRQESERILFRGGGSGRNPRPIQIARTIETRVTGWVKYFKFVNGFLSDW